MLLILLNTWSLANYTYDESEAFSNFKEVLDYIFVALFTVEFVLKLLGLGLQRFYQDKFNVFDGVVVIISLIEVIIH